MSAQQEAVALWQFLESRGVKPSIRMVGRILRDEMRVKVADHDLRRFLAAFTKGSRLHAAATPRSTAVAPQELSTNAAVAPHLAATAPRLRAQNKVSLVSNLFTNPTGLHDGASANVVGTEGKKTRRRGQDVDRSWIPPLKDQIRALLSRPLRTLDAEERVTLARYHVLRFANCAASQAGNRARAAPVAAGITNLAGHREHGSLLVSEYIAAEIECWEARGKLPHFRPWDITTFLVDAQRA